jgi:hypothetical protein
LYGGIYFLWVTRIWKQLAATIGAVFIDLGKLAFGSLMLGSILKRRNRPFSNFCIWRQPCDDFVYGGIWFIAISGE